MAGSGRSRLLNYASYFRAVGTIRRPNDAFVPKQKVKYEDLLGDNKPDLSQRDVNGAKAVYRGKSVELRTVAARVTFENKDHRLPMRVAWVGNFS